MGGREDEPKTTPRASRVVTNVRLGQLLSGCIFLKNQRKSSWIRALFSSGVKKLGHNSSLCFMLLL